MPGGTETLLPTYTLGPTKTPRPTGTPQPTITKSPTYTEMPTPTDTSTPLPPITLTAISKAATKTQFSIYATNTKGAFYFYSTATAEAKVAMATKKAEYKAISTKELETYPKNHIGEKIFMHGRIFNINGDTELQMYMEWTYDALYVVMKDPFDDIYEEDWITVFGTINGEYCGTNSFGGTICQPLLINAWYIKD